MRRSVCAGRGAVDGSDADTDGGHPRFSASSRKFSLAPSMPEVSFVITGLGGTESVIGNATSIFGKVLRQHSLVKARVERGRDQGSEELESRMALLGHPAEVLMSPQFASAEGLGPEEAMLRRWGLILADEHVSEETMSMLSFLLCEARCQRSEARQDQPSLCFGACVATVVLCGLLLEYDGLRCVCLLLTRALYAAFKGVQSCYCGVQSQLKC